MTKKINKCPRYDEYYGCAVSPSKKCNGCPDADWQRPKFKPGDWVVHTNDTDIIYQVEKVFKDGTYRIVPVDADMGKAITSATEEAMHPWAITDAKDGDVLYVTILGEEWLLLFKTLNYDPDYDDLLGFSWITSHCFYRIEDKWFGGIETDHYMVKDYSSIIPATKEQRDILSTRMMENGYIFLPNKKELVKLLFKVGDTVRKKSDGRLYYISLITEAGYFCKNTPLFPIECQGDFEIVRHGDTPGPKRHAQDKKAGAMRGLVTYPTAGADKRPVVSIAGRDFVVVPFSKSLVIPDDRIGLNCRHGLDGLGLELNDNARMFLQDVAAHLYHAEAFTAVEEGAEDGVRYFSMYLPVLMPLDEAQKWCLDMNIHEAEEMNQAYAERQRTGKPRAFKVVEWEEG